MKFSENWLRSFADPPLDCTQLADALTMGGIEVEAVDDVAPAFDAVVVGEVLAVKKHPNADRLNVCRVNAGDSELDVVCGAPNVRAGMRVPLARVGARLPETTIKAAKVRGVESAGMLCSARELGLSADAAGLLELPHDAPVGANLRLYLDLDDRIFTTKPTPNRGDCLSLLGMAREVAAITGAKISHTPAEVAAVANERVSIYLDAGAACPLYLGRVIRGVDAGVPTPAWMVRRLERSGLRSISAVVDVTNYVMFELGQPLHAFDLARVEGEIHVRQAHKAEQLKLLNERDIELDPSFLVIADRFKPLALAGIMGGLESAVKLHTRDILLESAFFDPSVIAGKSRALGFGTDSAFRFERGVDFGGTRAAMERATQLILEICGGHPGPVCEAAAELPARDPVRLRTARARRLLGMELSAERIEEVLRRLAFEYTASGEEFMVTPPSYRFDVAIEQDLIEEVVRIIGYDQVPSRQPEARAAMLPASETRASVRAVRAEMVAREYQEVVSYSFVDRAWEEDFCGNNDPIRLANPIAEQMSVMRSGLLGSLVDCLKVNLSRQQERVRLFEISRCFSREKEGQIGQTWKLGGIAYGDALPRQWGSVHRGVDFYDVKSDLESLVFAKDASYQPLEHVALHPGRAAAISVAGVEVGWLGELHPKLCQKYELPLIPIAFEIKLESILDRKLTKFRTYPRQPMVRRDISVEVGVGVPARALLDALFKAAPEVVSDIVLFDVYRGKGIDSDKKSIAFGVLLQDTVRTLTEVEIEAARERLIKVLQEQFHARLRK